MARIFGKTQMIRKAFLLALLMPVFVAPLRSQQANANPAAAPAPAPTQGVQQHPQQPPVDTKTEQVPPATPEQLRHAQIEADTKKLYQLSAELRAEVARTYKESLSLTVLKKAEEVEALARSLRILMNQEASARH